MTWDTKWAALSALGAVIAPFLAVFLFLLGRETKDLTVETVSRAVLVDLTQPSLSSLTLTYKDMAVSRLSVATLEIRNNGTRPIERADFEQPLVIHFINPLDVLAATINEKSPQDLNPVINSDSNGISIAPLLLNPGDSFRITVQLRGNFSEPTIEARISGISAVSRKMLSERNHTRKGFALIASGVILSWLYVYVAFLTFHTLFDRRSFTLIPRPENLIVVLALGAGSAGMTAFGATILDLSLAVLMPWYLVAFLPSFVLAKLARRRSSQSFRMLGQS